MRILQICHKMPWPVHDGGSFSLYANAVGLLENGAKVKIFAVNTPRLWIDPDSLPQEFISKTEFESHRIDTRIKPLNILGNLFRRQSYLVERFWDRSWNDKLIKILTKESFDIIQLEHTYLGLYIDTLRRYSQAKIVLRPQNVESDVWYRIAKQEIMPLRKWLIYIAAKRLRVFEKETSRKTDGIIAISSLDRETFQRFDSKKPVLAIPIGIDFRKVDQPIDAENRDSKLIFYHLGSMDWMPNLQGIKWFLKDIMPFIVKESPEFRFSIAGKNMPASFFKLQNNHFKVNGEIADAAKFHQVNDVLIVPLLSGGGIRVKIIEAMAMGKTVISTTIGAEGIPYTNGKNLLIANTKEQFAEQVKKCLREPCFCRKIGEDGKILALEHYNLKMVASKMMEFYYKLIGGDRVNL